MQAVSRVAHSRKWEILDVAACHDSEELIRIVRRVRKGPYLERPGAATASDIFFVFANRSGLGDQGPEQFYTYPDSNRSHPIHGGGPGD